jgi:hypothetical protein
MYSFATYHINIIQEKERLGYEAFHLDAIIWCLLSHYSLMNGIVSN